MFSITEQLTDSAFLKSLIRIVTSLYSGSRFKSLLPYDFYLVKAKYYQPVTIHVIWFYAVMIVAQHEQAAAERAALSLM